MSCARRIILLAYPSLQCISTLSIRDPGEGDNKEREKTSPHYQCIQFSETEHVIALTSFPGYNLEVWNWRTGTLLLAQPTRVNHHNQFIRFVFAWSVCCVCVCAAEEKMMIICMRLDAVSPFRWALHKLRSAIQLGCIFGKSICPSIMRRPLKRKSSFRLRTMTRRWRCDWYTIWMVHCIWRTAVAAFGMWVWLGGALRSNFYSILFIFSHFWWLAPCFVQVSPISKKIIDISKRLICDEMADSNENTKIELYKEGIIVAGSEHGIKVSRFRGRTVWGIIICARFPSILWRRRITNGTCGQILTLNASLRWFVSSKSTCSQWRSMAQWNDSLNKRIRRFNSMESTSAIGLHAQFAIEIFVFDGNLTMHSLRP